MRLGLGRARFTSKITCESEQLVFAALHFGDHNLSCGICAYQDEETYRKLVEEITSAFSKADIPEVLRIMDKELGSTYSLKSLFYDDRRAILRQILNPSLEEAEAAYQQIHEHHVPLAHFLRDLGVPLPKVIRTAAEFALNSRLRRALANEDMEGGEIQRLLEEARSDNIALDITTLEYTLRLTIERLFDHFAREPHDVAGIERLEALIEMARSLPFEVDLWTAQNVWSEISRTVSGEFSRREQAGDQEARNWLEHFHLLGEKLQVRIAARLQVLSQTG
jgi:hypothetical protein